MIRMVPPEEYGKFHYPDYPRARTPAALVRHFRKTSPEYFDKVTSDVKANGFTTPVLVRWKDPSGRMLKKPHVMEGHHRAAVAHELGLHLPVGDYDSDEDYEVAHRAGQQWWRDNERPTDDMPKQAHWRNPKSNRTEHWPPYLDERLDPEDGELHPVNVSRSNPRGPVGTEDEAKAAGLVGPYYHGTHKRRAQDIRRGGFRQPRMHNHEMHEWGDIEEINAGNTHRTYFATTPEDALHFARGNYGEHADVVKAYLHPDHLDANGGAFMSATTVKDVAHTMVIRPEPLRSKAAWDHADGSPRWVEPHANLVRDALTNWRGSPADMQREISSVADNNPLPDSANGTHRINRARAEALHHEIFHGRSTPTLYRGAIEAGLHPSVPTSWSENRSVAEHWAKKTGGVVHSLMAGAGCGVRMADHIDDPEQQWLVVANNHHEAARNAVGKNSTKPQKCQYCKQPATKSILWAEGMGYIPVCDDHEQRARHRIEVTNDDEVVGVHEIGRTAAQQSDEGSGEFHPDTEAVLRELKRLESPSGHLNDNDEYRKVYEHDDGSLTHRINKQHVPISHVYRAVSESDFHRMRGQGYLDTHGEGNMINQGENAEGMVASSHPYIHHYIPFSNEPGRVIKIHVRPEDKWSAHRVDGPHYVQTERPDSRIPWDRVEDHTGPMQWGINPDTWNKDHVRMQYERDKPSGADEFWGKHATYYHGTAIAGVTQVLPARNRGYAYATTLLDQAWAFALQAHHAGSGQPRVYEVRPIAEQPHYAGREARSASGWEVVREMPMPEHMGRPEEWR